MTDTTANLGIVVGSDAGKVHRARRVITVNKLRYAVFNCTGRTVPLYKLYVTGTGDLNCKACLKKETA